MKKVRFETPTKVVLDIMQEYECHSPRPFIGRQVVNITCNTNQGRPVVFSNDPEHRFENDNSLPYPTANKTSLDVARELENKKVPSSDLDLSMLDCLKPRIRTPTPEINTVFITETDRVAPINSIKSAPHILAGTQFFNSIENTITRTQQPLKSRDDEFFLKKENLGPIHQQHDLFNISNENNPHRQKSYLIQKATRKLSNKENYPAARIEIDNDCNCHHCVRIVNHTPHHNNQTQSPTNTQNNYNNMEHLHRHVPRINCHLPEYIAKSSKCSCNCNMHIIQPTCNCNNPHSPFMPQNAIDKKTWAIEKYEKTKDSGHSEIEKCDVVLKEKREATVSDLFKIIKLQNEQLQLLQEKVDRFISSHSKEVQEKQKIPIQDYMTEQLAVQTVNSEQHKISIGVMTSFEMVRTSTVINKEIVKQCEAQIQCNRSQISMKEVVSKKHAENLNFLEGLSPVSKNIDRMNGVNELACLNWNNDADNVIEDKTLNELSLYNVQVDNATTPLMSPEQSLYLDVRDYSESDSGSDDQSNVGWTYYNKVMTHVNGMLQDSDMPSSASALCRQTKQKCMQVDKSNVSVGKRVTFGDDPFGIQQRHITTPTDTSLKMNQLAAKYLKHAPPSHTPSPKASEEMSFATRKYMERHKLLQGQNAPIQQDIPRFLDITALKQQPKFI